MIPRRRPRADKVDKILDQSRDDRGSSRGQMPKFEEIADMADGPEELQELTEAASRYFVGWESPEEVAAAMEMKKVSVENRLRRLYVEAGEDCNPRDWEGIKHNSWENFVAVNKDGEIPKDELLNTEDFLTGYIAHKLDRSVSGSQMTVDEIYEGLPSEYQSRFESSAELKRNLLESDNFAHVTNGNSYSAFMNSPNAESYERKALRDIVEEQMNHLE